MQLAMDPESVKESLAEMGKVLKLGNEIMERLRLFVRRDAVATELCEIGDAVASAIEICRPRSRSSTGARSRSTRSSAAGRGFGSTFRCRPRTERPAGNLSNARERR
ncbi:MAG: hypothetical protein U0271_07205 [Polyangiaceae bacterium]